MPFEIHTPPWTDFHNLNLDWLLQKMKEIESDVAGETALQKLVSVAIANNKLGVEVAINRNSSQTVYSGQLVALCNQQQYVWSSVDLFRWEALDPGQIKVVEDGIYQYRIVVTITTGSANLYINNKPADGGAAVAQLAEVAGSGKKVITGLVAAKAGDSLGALVEPVSGSNSVGVGANAIMYLLKVL